MNVEFAVLRELLVVSIREIHSWQTFSLLTNLITKNFFKTFIYKSCMQTFYELLLFAFFCRSRARHFVVLFVRRLIVRKSEKTEIVKICESS